MNFPTTGIPIKMLSHNQTARIGLGLGPANGTLRNCFTACISYLHFRGPLEQSKGRKDGTALRRNGV